MFLYHITVLLYMNIFFTSMWLPAIAKLYMSTIMSLRTDAAIIGHICVDCELAAKFACGERKANYVMRFGLAPHFKAHINSAVNRCSAYVLLFDESYNAVTKNKQMDIFIRYCHITGRVMSESAAATSSRCSRVTAEHRMC